MAIIRNGNYSIEILIKKFDVESFAITTPSIFELYHGIYKLTLLKKKIFFILSISIEIAFITLKLYYNTSIILWVFTLLFSCISFFIVFPYMILVSTAIYNSLLNQEELNGKEEE